MQLSTFEILQDFTYSDKKVMIGLSGGINSAAALVYLATQVEDKPDDIYLYYAHLEEHSEDTKPFVLGMVEWAKGYFENVIFESNNDSMNRYCREEFKGIPHSAITPCTKILKLVYMVEFMEKHSIDLDIVGYVRDEYRRIQRQIDRGVEKKDYLIRHLSDEDCFSIVEKYFGWYPDIYKIMWNDKRIGEALNEYGHELHPKQRAIIETYYNQGYNHRNKTYRVFKHNNCLPCKNMHQWEIWLVKVFYRKEYDEAMKTASDLNSYWGRKDEYTDENSDCAICSI